jgi:hypothetical protein
MDDRPHIRYAIVSALQLLIFNSQLLARQLRRADVLRTGRGALLERTTRLLTVTDALVRTVELLADQQSNLLARRQARTLTEQLVHLVGYVKLLETQARSDGLQPLRLAEYADGLREEALALLPLVDAALGNGTTRRT